MNIKINENVSVRDMIKRNPFLNDDKKPSFGEVSFSDETKEMLGQFKLGVNEKKEGVKPLQEKQTVKANQKRGGGRGCM